LCYLRAPVAVNEKNLIARGHISVAAIIKELLCGGTTDTGQVSGHGEAGAGRICPACDCYREQCIVSLHNGSRNSRGQYRRDWFAPPLSGEAVLRGVGAPVTKSLPFWLVSVVPLFLRNTAVVLLGAGGRGGCPQKQFTPVPNPTISAMVTPVGHAPTSAVVLLERATLPAVALIAIVPLAIGSRQTRGATRTLGFLNQVVLTGLKCHVGQVS